MAKYGTNEFKILQNRLRLTTNFGWGGGIEWELGIDVPTANI